MHPPGDRVQNLITLNQIAETLNRAVDVRGVLNDALAQLVELMGLDTGWIFLGDPVAQGIRWGRGYVLAAHHNLPPALALDDALPWDGGCECQELCSAGALCESYNEVRCSRLTRGSGDRRGLRVHASVPLRSGERVLGIINVAGHDWTSFSSQALALLNNVGSQMGEALERARLFDLLQEQRVREQAALLDFTSELLCCLDLDELMRSLVAKVRRLVGADACALLVPSEEAGQLAYRAAAGWDVDPVTERRKVPADRGSGPGTVMQTQQPLLVPDVGAGDPTIWAPDWLRSEGFRGYALVPVVAEGRSIGVLAIYTRRPGLLDDERVRFLRLMANQAAIAIEQARLHHEELQRQQFESELAVGRQIQLGLLPKEPPAVPGWDYAVVYQAARQVGGDFYDFFELSREPGRLGMVIADVAGKGVPAALFMALSRTMIRTTALSGRTPSAALIRANELILKDSRADLFLTAFYGVLDSHSGRLVYANAGHNRPLCLRAATGEFQELAARGTILGMLEEVELEERELEVAPGDLLLFYTDGVTEAMDAEGRAFGEERLREAAGADPTAGAQQVLDRVLDALRAFTGDAPQSDDLTLFVVKRSL